MDWRSNNIHNIDCVLGYRLYEEEGTRRPLFASAWLYLGGQLEPTRMPGQHSTARTICPYLDHATLLMVSLLVMDNDAQPATPASIAAQIEILTCKFSIFITLSNKFYFISFLASRWYKVGSIPIICLGQESARKKPAKLSNYGIVFISIIVRY